MVSIDEGQPDGLGGSQQIGQHIRKAAREHLHPVPSEALEGLVGERWLARVCA